MGYQNLINRIPVLDNVRFLFSRLDFRLVKEQHCSYICAVKDLLSFTVSTGCT